MTGLTGSDKNRKRRGGRRPPRSHEEAAEFAAWAVHRVSQGRITADEGKVIALLLKEYRELHEMALLTKRIAELQARLNEQPTP